MSTQLWFLSILGLVLFLSTARHATGENRGGAFIEATNETEDAENPNDKRGPLLRPRNLASATESVDVASSQTEVGTKSWTSRFSVGIYINQDISFARPSDTQTSTGLTAEGTVPESGAPNQELGDGSTAASGFFVPLLSVRAGYQLFKNFSLIGSLGANFRGGIQDPAFGIAYYNWIGNSVWTVTSLTASLPLSSISREDGKISTISLAFSPIYTGKDFFFGGTAQLSGSIYGEPSTASSSSLITDKVAASTTTSNLATTAIDTSTTGTVGRELVRVGGEAFAGYLITRNLSGSIHLGATNAYLDSDEAKWITTATVARLTYGYQGFRGSAAFNLVAQSTSPTVPTQPGVGLRLQYVFGSQAAIGVGGTEAIPVRR